MKPLEMMVSNMQMTDTTPADGTQEPKIRKSQVTAANNEASELQPLPQIDAKEQIKRSATNFLGMTVGLDGEASDMSLQSPNRQAILEAISKNMGDKAINDKTKARALNDITQYQKKRGRDYLEKIRFTVALSSLYEVVASPNFSQANGICPVLLKLGSHYDFNVIDGEGDDEQSEALQTEESKDFESEDDEKETYVLQVWSSKGTIIFQRIMERNKNQPLPVTNWNVFGNIFLFQETDIEIVYMLDCTPGQSPKLYRLQFPHVVMMVDSTKDLDPDVAIKRTLGYWNGFVLAPFANTIFFANIERDIKKGKAEILDQSRGYEECLFFSQLPSFQISNEFELMMCQDITGGQTAVILQGKTGNNKNRLSFLRVRGIDEENSQIDFCKLGNSQIDQNLLENKRAHGEVVKELAPIKEMISVMYPESKSSGTDENCEEIRPNLTKYYQAGMSLRTDGSVTFYVDFSMVSHSDPEIIDGQKHVCCDIATDNDKFYIQRKRVDVAKSNYYYSKKKAQREIQVLSCDISWRHRIGLNSSKCCHTQIERMNLVLHMRIAPYFKLYSAFINFDTFLMVASGRRVSVFDLTNDDDNMLRSQFSFSETIMSLCIVKGADSQNQVVVTLANAKYVLISKEGLNLQIESAQSIAHKENQQVLQTTTDQYTNKTLLFLTTECTSPLHKIRDDRNFIRDLSPEFSIDYDAIGDASSCIELWALHNGATVKLLDSNSLAPICQFDKDDNFLGQPSVQNETQSLQNASTEEQPLILRGKCQLKIFPIGQREEKHINLVISNQSKQFSNVYSFKEPSHGRQSIPETITTNEKTIYLEKINSEPIRHSPLDKGELKGVIYAQGEDFQKTKGFFARVTDDGIAIYDKDFKFKCIFKNLEIKEMLVIDDCFMYCLTNPVNTRIQKEFYQKETGMDKKKVCQVEARGVYPVNRVAGLYVYDISRLIDQGQVEIYKLSRAIAGANTQIDFSLHSQRISFVESFSKLQMQNLPHRSKINFLGMSSKNEYLIWREKNGFFSALDKQGYLHTWSMASGRHLYDQTLNGSVEMVKNFEVCQSAPNDETYCKKYYDTANRTIQLLRSKEPISTHTQKDNSLETTLTKFQESDIRLNSIRPKSGIKKQNQQHGKLRQTKGQDKQKVIDEDGMFQCSDEKASVNVDNDLKFQTYQFKVIQLQMHQDKELDRKGKQYELGEERISELFSFSWDIQTYEENKGNDAQATLASNAHDEAQAILVTSEMRQILYLSKDTTRLMEVIGGKEAKIYERPKYLGHQKHVEWKLLGHVRQYPQLLAQKTDTQFLFSPNFDKYIDIEYVTENFVIKSSLNNELPATIIPSDLISIKENSLKSIETVVKIASRSYFIDDECILYVTKKGLMLLIDISKKDQGPQVVDYCKFDNYELEDELDHKNFFLDPAPLEDDDTIKKLSRRLQGMKCEMTLANWYCDKDIKKGKPPRFDTRLTQSQNFAIDYSSKWSDNNSVFTSETSFTLLNWFMLDDLRSKPQFTIKDVDWYQQQQLCFNVLPGRKTILHELVKASLNQSTEDNQLNTNMTVKCLFDVCKKSHVGEEPKEVPIIHDIYGKTPLDWALDLPGIKDRLYRQKSDDKRSYKCIRKIQKLLYAFRMAKKPLKHTNASMAGLIFACIKDYSYLHSGPLLAAAINKAIKKSIPGIGEYLESRQIENEQMPSPNQRRLQKYDGLGYLIATTLGFQSVTDTRLVLENNRQVSQEYGVIAEKVYQRKGLIRDRMFDKFGPETRMEMFYFDIPNLHRSAKQGRDFITALNKTEDINIFSNFVVQGIINYHWKRIKWVSYLAQLTPFVIQLILFTYWSNWVLDKNTDELGMSDKICRYGLSIFSCYFILLELGQFLNQGLKYFITYQNYLEIAPLILILINVHNYSPGHNDEMFYRVWGVAALLMWFKFFYFLRQFESTSYLIRSLIEVFRDMYQFMFVLACLIIGIADCFGSISRGRIAQQKQPIVEGGFVEQLIYSYLVALGEFQYDQYDWFSWAIFTVATITQMIVMLNLLIAIISATFQRVCDEQIQHTYRERAGLIQDLYQFLLAFQTTSEAQNQLLFFAREDPQNKDAIPDDLDTEADTQVEQIQLITETVTKIQSKIDKIMGRKFDQSGDQEDEENQDDQDYGEEDEQIQQQSQLLHIEQQQPLLKSQNETINVNDPDRTIQATKMMSQQQEQISSMQDQISRLKTLLERQEKSFQGQSSLMQRNFSETIKSIKSVSPISPQPIQIGKHQKQSRQRIREVIEIEWSEPTTEQRNFFESFKPLIQVRSDIFFERFFVVSVQETEGNPTLYRAVIQVSSQDYLHVIAESYPDFLGKKPFLVNMEVGKKEHDEFTLEANSNEDLQAENL